MPDGQHGPDEPDPLPDVKGALDELANRPLAEHPPALEHIHQTLVSELDRSAGS